MSAKRYGGHTARMLRAYWRPRLPLPCWRCGHILTADRPWTVGHLVDRAAGGSNGAANTHPECPSCNFRAGARTGARRRRARAAAASPISDRDRGIRPW